MGTRRLIWWLTRKIRTGPFKGSNRLSLMLRLCIEKLPVKRLVGVQLAAAAFFSVVVAPSAAGAITSLEIANETKTTVIEVAATTQSKLQWPVTDFGITTRFSVAHPGIDMIADFGTPVFPVAGGRVVWTKILPWGYGKHVLVEHADGLKSLYGHLSAIAVKDGDRISENTQIGNIGSTGWSTGNHLHLEIYQEEVAINPLEALPQLIKPSPIASLQSR